MLQIISNVPTFVWPLFVILLTVGLKARKTSEMPLLAFLLLPSVFFIWSVTSFFGKYAADPVAICLWAVFLASGVFVGYSHMQKLKLQFDKQKKMVKVPGSWIPLILAMSIFSAKFSIGMISGMLPELKGSILVFALELFSTAILGIFAGRGISCLLRYRTALPNNQ